MNSPGRKLVVLDRRGYEREYLHKDFHGALCYAVKYLDDTFGPTVTEEYLREVGRNLYRHVQRDLQERGLAALESHWNKVFSKEEGAFSMHYEGGTLVLTVERCPAIAHLQRTGQFFTERYCETTVVVNDALCSAVGYGVSCEYEPGAGRCVQKFWKLRGA